LLIPISRSLPPLLFYLGVKPIQAAISRPRLNWLASPTAPMNAVAVTGPIPGTCKTLGVFMAGSQIADALIQFIQSLFKNLQVLPQTIQQKLEVSTPVCYFNAVKRERAIHCFGVTVQIFVIKFIVIY
jgi:hypothetical protein